MLHVALLLLAPLVGIFYAVLEHFGVCDRMSGRDKALEGLRRLRSCAGYPVNWIFDDQADKPIFDALFRRIKKHSREEAIISALAAGRRPSLIATAGKPIAIKGVPANWPQDAKFFYSENHPILGVFGVARGMQFSQGKAEKTCTLRDMEEWLLMEKKNRDFYVGTLMVGTLSAILIVMQTQLVSE